MLSLKTVTVQVSPATKLTFGVMIQRLPPNALATVALLCEPVVAQLMSYHDPAASTSSVKLTLMLASRGAVVALLRGPTLSTYGPISTIGVVRRGFGAPVTKSEPLKFVS